MMELNCLCDIYSGYAFKSFNDTSDGIPVIKIGNILSDGTIELTDCVYTEEVPKEKYYSKKDDIYIALSGATTGKIGVMQTDGLYVINQRVGIIRNKGKIPNDYLKYFLVSKSNQILKEASGCAQPNISPKQISKYDISIQTEEKMLLITQQLKKIEVILQNYRNQIDLLDELVKARFVEMFGDMKPTVKLNKYIIELRAGKSLAGNEICKNKVLKTGAATFGFFDKDQYKYYPKEYKPNPLHKVETGDVIISRMNTPELVGACSYVYEAPDNTYYPDRLWKVIVNENTNPIFLWQLMWQQEIRKQIKENSYGTSGTMNNISKIKLLNINAIDVPISLQNQFADFVKEVDKSRLEVQKSLKKTQELFDSLIQKYFG
jgi:type I restriction enzyme S subunit